MGALGRLEDLKVPVSWIKELVNGARSTTPDLVKRLATSLQTSVELWTILQDNYDAKMKKRKRIC